MMVLSAVLLVVCFYCRCLPENTHRGGTNILSACTIGKVNVLTVCSYFHHSTVGECRI